MKLFKKTAALLFCLALALSVMAISASATDDPTFTVTLVQNETDDDHENIDTSDDLVEYDQGETVVYDIKLAASVATDVSAVDFTLNIPTGLTLQTVTNVIANDEAEENNNVYTLNLTTGGAETTGANATATRITTGAAGGVVIATITLEVDDDADDSAELEFLVEDVVIHKVGVNNEVTNNGDSATIKVDPEYTVSVYSPSKDDDTGILTLTTKAEGDPLYTFKYTLFDGDQGEAVYAASDGHNVANEQTVTVEDFPGYKFNNTFIVAANAGGNATDGYAWEAGDEVEATDSINDINTDADTSKWGDVDLIAQYDLVTYTVTYNFDCTDSNVDTAPTPAYNESTGLGYTAATASASATVKYTIESAATTTFGILERTGYDFKGWKVSAPTATGNDYDEIDFNDSFWSNYANDGTGDFDTTAEEPDTATMAYGNVTLTAHWAIVGEFVKANYKYAKSGDVLVLFAVNKANAPGGVYYCGAGNAMFIMNDADENDSYDGYGALAAAYAALFGTTTVNEAPVPNVTTDGWTIYGYLADSETKDTDIIFVGTNDADGDENESIVYDGNVNKTQDGTVNAGDYGIVIDLLAGLGTTGYDTNLGVESRLKAHIESTAVVSSTLGTIQDVAAIMELVGA